MRNYVILLVLIVAACLLVGVSASRAQMLGRKLPCQTIDSTPYTISTPGRYCLSGDSTSSATNAVTITSSNVIFDCSGFSLRTSTVNSGTFGVIAYPSVENVTIQNCNIVNFGTGIAAGPLGNGLQVINNRIQNAGLGLRVSGGGARIVGNRVIATSGEGVGILVSPSGGAPTPMLGVVLLNNVVAGVASDHDSYGIWVKGLSRPQFSSNQVLDLNAAAGFLGRSIVLGVDPATNVSTTNASVINNTMMSRGTSPVQGLVTDGPANATCVGNIAIALSNSGFSSACQTDTNNSDLP